MLLELYIYPLQCNGDAPLNLNDLVGDLSANAEGLLDASEEKLVYFTINKCLSNRHCKLRNKFKANKSFISSAANRTYDVIIPSTVLTVNCAISICIYILTFSNCFLQYVRETEQTLRKRFNNHKSAIQFTDSL